jgi:AtzE family amidohydrolase
VNLGVATIAETTARIRSGEVTALELTEAALERIARRDSALNCFTRICVERARAAAARIDAACAAGQKLPPLAGVPYGVKDLFDVAGLPTLAGSKINADDPPAKRDAAVICRLESAGTILVGTMNMDEYACGLTTENSHYGPTLNPHDHTRVAGGSSGGSAAAVADGLVPFSLGSDTNGSVRVPASLCGVYGMKPTFGRISRTGLFSFAPSFDHVGFFARSASDLALVYDTLRGADPDDPASPVMATRRAALRVAVTTGYFAEHAELEALEAVGWAAERLQARHRIDLPETARARAAAAVITACESGNLHLARLRRRSADFDPLVRPRLIAGALCPAQWYLQAQPFRRWYRGAVLRALRGADVLLAPATPCVAPLLGQETNTLDGTELPMRLSLGIYTQPISFIGLPGVVVPAPRAGRLPIGVQIVARPWREADCLRAANALANPM